MTNSTKYEAAISAHQKGALDQALLLYTEILQISPDNAEILSLKGSVLSQQGNVGEAEKLLYSAVELEPQEEGFWVNLAAHLLRQKEAGKATRVLAENIPDTSEQTQSWQCLLTASLASGNTELSVSALKKLLSIDYSFKRLISLSQLLVRAEDKPSAIEVLERFQKQAKNEASYWHALCWLYDAEQHWVKLVEAALSWRNQFENDKNAYRFLASGYFELGRQHDAIAVYEKLLSSHASDETSEAQNDKAKYVELCVNSLALEKAEETAQKLTQSGFSSAGLLNAQVQLAVFSGDKEKAKALCLTCVERFPDYLPIYTHLVRVEPNSITSNQLTQLQTAINEGHQDSDTLSFTLAHYYHSNENYAEAMCWYQRANELRSVKNAQKGSVYREDEAEDFYQRVVNISHQLQERFAEAYKSKQYQCQPIFVIGMPRSGTTLLEGMLACHPSIHKMGERIELPNLLRSLIQEDIDPLQIDSVLNTFVNEYTQAFSNLDNNNKACFFVDKNPANYMSVGIIQTLFPNALIINIEREPIETIVSIYRHEFSHMWSYATSLESIAHQYGIYQKFITHWQQASENVVSIQYESLVEQPEQVIQSLMQKMGIEFDDIDFNQGMAQQAFTTFSALQVRDKVSNFNGVAMHYLPYVEPGKVLTQFIYREAKP